MSNSKKLPNEYPGQTFQPLFDHMLQEHGITLLESEMTDIITLCDLLIKTDYDKKRQQAVSLGLISEKSNNKELVGALEKIANYKHECGCVPCVGQCRTAEALQIEIDELKEIAAKAISKQK